jgi:CHAD domain-containing protein
MNRKQAEHIIKRHYREMRKQVAVILKNVDPVAIHKFRVAYKKLRAVARMISHSQPNRTKIAISKKLKKAYGIAGQIRDRQLQQERVIKETHPGDETPVYCTFLDKEIDQNKKKLASILSPETVLKSKKKTIGALPQKMASKIFQKYAGKILDDLAVIVTAEKSTPAALHTIRKKLKDFMYTSEAYVIAEVTPPQFAGAENTSNRIHQITDELGIYQDKQTAIKLLENYADAQSKAGRGLDTVRKKWAAELAELQKQLLEKYRPGFSPYSTEQAKAP